MSKTTWIKRAYSTYQHKIVEKIKPKGESENNIGSQNNPFLEPKTFINNQHICPKQHGLNVHFHACQS